MFSRKYREQTKRMIEENYINPWVENKVTKQKTKIKYIDIENINNYPEETKQWLKSNNNRW